MVWKHSYMEVLPLTTAMYYFSQHYKECSDMEAGWCNIPNKGHLQPTHMMIAAYHNKNVVWAYKGWFNWNIDHDWTGGVLVEPVQVVDNCLRTDHSVGKPPAPSTEGGDRRLLGIAFDKVQTNTSQTVTPYMVLLLHLLTVAGLTVIYVHLQGQLHK